MFEFYCKEMAISSLNVNYLDKNKYELKKLIAQDQKIVK